jgi:hypothetical protein
MPHDHHQAAHDRTAGLRRAVPALTACVLLVAAPPLAAQFGTPGSTLTRERVAGDFVLGSDVTAIEPGDQVGAFFDDELVGVFTVTNETGTDGFSFIVFGDDPETPDVVEGPSRNDRVEFRFFDSSTNGERIAQPLNSSGEPFNYRYGGEVLPPIPDGFPIDLTPTASIDLRIGDPSDNDNGGGNGGGDEGGDGGGNSGGASPDVDGDGKITTKDAAIVLRFVVGSAAAGVSASRADINGDGRVDTDDAIAILRQR